MVASSGSAQAAVFDCEDCKTELGSGAFVDIESKEPPASFLILLSLFSSLCDSVGK